MFSWFDEHLPELLSFGEAVSKVQQINYISARTYVCWTLVASPYLNMDVCSS